MDRVQRLTFDGQACKVTTMLTAEEVDELYTLVHGVQKDLVALIGCEPRMHDLLIENALKNNGRAITLVTKLHLLTGEYA